MLDGRLDGLARQRATAIRPNNKSTRYTREKATMNHDVIIRGWIYTNMLLLILVHAEEEIRQGPPEFEAEIRAECEDILKDLAFAMN
jgi:hypothetical protein